MQVYLDSALRIFKNTCHIDHMIYDTCHRPYKYDRLDLSKLKGEHLNQEIGRAGLVDPNTSKAHRTLQFFFIITTRRL